MAHFSDWGGGEEITQTVQFEFLTFSNRVCIQQCSN